MCTLILQNFIDVKIELVPAGLVNAPLFVKLKKKNSNIQIGQLRSVPRNTSHLVESARQSPPKNKHQELWMLTKLWKRGKKSARLSRTLGNAEPVVTSERRFRGSCEEGREFGTIRPLYLSSGRRRKSKKNGNDGEASGRETREGTTRDTIGNLCFTLWHLAPIVCLIAISLLQLAIVSLMSIP